MTEEEFIALFRRVFPRLVRLAVRYGYQQDAHDLAARALEILWTKNPEGPRNEEERGQLDALAFTVLRGLMQNQNRSRRRRLALQQRIASKSGPAECESEQLPHEWPAWFLELDRRDKEMLLLLADGYSVREIAAILGCTYAAAAQRLSRARRRAQAALAWAGKPRG